LSQVFPGETFWRTFLQLPEGVCVCVTGLKPVVISEL